MTSTTPIKSLSRPSSAGACSADKRDLEFADDTRGVNRGGSVIPTGGVGSVGVPDTLGESSATGDPGTLGDAVAPGSAFNFGVPVAEKDRGGAEGAANANKALEVGVAGESVGSNDERSSNGGTLSGVFIDDGGDLMGDTVSPS